MSLFKQMYWQDRTCCRPGLISSTISVHSSKMVHVQASIHWTSIYTQRLGSKVKLVGSTINCQPVHYHSDPSKERRQIPHVQSYVAATDQVTEVCSTAPDMLAMKTCNRHWKLLLYLAILSFAKTV